MSIDTADTTNTTDTANTTNIYNQKSVDDKCSICLEELTAESRISELKCSHYIHTDCLIDYCCKNKNSHLCMLCSAIIIPNKKPKNKKMKNNSSREISPAQEINPQTRHNYTFSTLEQKRPIINKKLDLKELPKFHFYTYLDNRYTRKELCTVEELDCSYNIFDINNLFIYFPNLIKLICSGCGIKNKYNRNAIPEIIKIKAPKLEYLDISYNEICYLNLCCPNLSYLDISINKFTSINHIHFKPYIPPIFTLKYLNCSFNNFSKLYLKKFNNLKYVDCSNNFKLTNVDVNSNVKINHIYTDVAIFSKIKWFFCN
jgi:hypothetical protein